MASAYPDILTGDELIEVLEECMPERVGFIEEVREFVNEANAVLGYGVAETTCALCGYVGLAVFEIPSAFPADCPNCGQRAGYMTDTPEINESRGR
jgi:hypothetical protein